MTLGSAAAACVRLIVWCNECQHQVEPDPAEMAARYGAETPVLDWRERLAGARIAADKIFPPFCSRWPLFVARRAERFVCDSRGGRPPKSQRVTASRCACQNADHSPLRNITASLRSSRGCAVWFTIDIYRSNDICVPGLSNHTLIVDPPLITSPYLRHN
jgi:hypothetical protein